MIVITNPLNGHIRLEEIYPNPGTVRRPRRSSLSRASPGQPVANGPSTKPGRRAVNSDQAAPGAPFQSVPFRMGDDADSPGPAPTTSRFTGGPVALGGLLFFQSPAPAAITQPPSACPRHTGPSGPGLMQQAPLWWRLSSPRS